MGGQIGDLKRGPTRNERLSAGLAQFPQDWAPGTTERGRPGHARSPHIVPWRPTLPYPRTVFVTTRVALAAMALGSLFFTSAAYAAPTSLDHGFGRDGVLRLQDSGHSEILADQAVLTNGEIEVVTLTQSDPAVELRRLHPDGRLDRTFGDHGVVAFARSASYEDVHLAYDRRTGKSYVSTFLDNGTTSPTTIWRFKKNGRLDLRFGRGLGHFDIEQFVAHDMVAVRDQALRVVGTDFSIQRPVVLGIQSVGGTDDFGNASGETILSHDSNDEADSIAALPGGKLAVAGGHYSATSSMLLAFRLAAGGRIDHSFGHNGRASIDPSSSGVTTSTVWNPQVLVRPDGRTAYVAGLNQSDHGTFATHLFTTGLTRSGHLDRVFRTHIFRRLMTYQTNASLTGTGRLVMSAARHGVRGDRNTVVRLTTHGSLDKTWSKDGILSLAGASPMDLITVDVTAQGRVIVARTLGDSHYLVEIRAYRGTPPA